MNFQTNTAIFTGKVVARSAQQVVNTETLEATLNRAVDFSNPNIGANPTGAPAAPGERLDLAALRTRGWTFLEGRQLDENGQQTTLSQMAVNDLSIDRTSGDIGGVGPGWVKHVSLGAPQPVGVPGQKPPEPKPGEKDKLTYLHVDFRKGLSGNLNRRDVKFFDQTKTLYGPVADWSDELTDKDLSGLGATGMSLAADTLEVREMNSRPGSKRGFFELDAKGSIFAEGQRFAAQGSRLTYAEQNDQLALHGEPAELFMENQNGGPRQEIRAKQVQYWFKDHRVWTNGANLVNMVFPNTGASKPRPAAEKSPSAAGPIISPPSAAPPPINALPPSTSSLPPR